MTIPNQEPEPNQLQNFDTPFAYYPEKQIGVTVNSKGEFESGEETTARLKREAEESTARLKREDESHVANVKLKYYSFICALLLICVTSVVCFYLILTTEKKWPEATLTAIISGFFGYLSGRNQSSPK